MSKHITIQNVADATGLSRTTVYRRLNGGSTREELMANAKPRIIDQLDLPDQLEPVPPGSFEPPAENGIDPDDKAAIAWCKAVLWASENWHENKMSLAKAGSALRLSMWKSAREYPKELLIQLMPRALKILDDNKDDGTSAETEAKERKSVKDLKELLAGAIEESKSV